MDIHAFDYDLPPDRIAQIPVERRDTSRLLLVHREADAVEEYPFHDLPQVLRTGDVLVINDTWVMPARLHGTKVGGGAAIEVLLLEELGGNRWKVIAQRATRLYPGVEIEFPEEVRAIVEVDLGGGLFEMAFRLTDDWEGFLERHGGVPLPPYIKRPDSSFRALDRERYQTVYSRVSSRMQSAAAPTAGLHFTEELLTRLRDAGVMIVPVTLRVGLDTFQPIRSARVEDHTIHCERFAVPESTAEAVNRARSAGGRIVAVGTTVVRALESAAEPDGTILPRAGDTSLFITPGYRFRAIDGLISNFHLPRSTLLVLIAAWLGGERWRAVYSEALQRGFRFYSYGDTMLAW